MENAMAPHDYLIHADGGARGNPGPAAIGFTIAGPDITPVEHGAYIGETTNNVAEYTAVIKALAKLKSLLGSGRAKTAAVRVQVDSELLVRQLNSEYKVKDETLGKLFVQVHNAQQDFQAVSFVHVPREQNRDADRLVNEALDKEGVPKFGF
jgi:ribonuclease HI